MSDSLALPDPLTRPLPRLGTAGPQIVAISDGRQVPICLRGINRSSFQYLHSLREAGLDDPEGELRQWREGWGVDIVRFPIGVDQYQQSQIYRDELDLMISAAAQAGVYLMIEQHARSTDYQIALPTEESEPAWRDLARRHAQATHLCFDLWNEPHDVDWRTWQQRAQTLVDAIRGEGAVDTLIVVGGLDWAYDLSPLQQHGNRLWGNGPLAYATHPYPIKGGMVHGPAQWDERFGRISQELPVMVTEYGCDIDGDPFFRDPAAARRWLQQLFTYLDQRGLCALAWSGGNRPHLVRGRSGAPVSYPDNPPDPQRPTSPFGEEVQRWLRSPRPLLP